MIRLVLALVFLSAQPVWAQCVVGVSVVPCDLPPVRTRTVPGNCSTIQQCVSTAQPGDLILVKAGTYAAAVNATISGTAQRPIVLRGEPGAVIALSGKTEADSVWLQGSYWILENFEVNGGWHGVRIDGKNVLLRNNHIHHAGRTQGQNVLVSNSDVAVLGGWIHHPGLGSPSPKLSHNVYVSDYYGRSIVRSSVVNVDLTDSPGAGFQVWNSTRRVTDIRLESVRFARNVVDVTLTNVDRIAIVNSTFTHNGGNPPTNWNLSAWLWLELSTALQFERNRFESTVTSCALITGSQQTLAPTWWTANTWSWPTGCQVFDDAQLNRAGGH